MADKQLGYELDKIAFRIKKDVQFRDLFFSNFDLACQEYRLTEEERISLKARDYKKLAELGLKPELVIALAKIDEHE